MLTAPTAAPIVEAAPEIVRQRSALPQWAPLAAVVLLLGVVTWNALRPLSDPDTWWHLRLGQLFRDGWALSDPGQLSPFAEEPWVPTQWLSEVVASFFEQWFGLAGVVWLAGAAVLTLVFAVYRNCRLRADTLASALATTLAFVGMLAGLTPRPHLVTYVLLTVTVGAWLRTTQDRRPRWWLVPLTWVWACSHGMWFTGVLVGLAVTIGLVADRRLTRKQALRLASVPFLSVLAAAVTPVGPALLRAPFAVNEITSYISEWAPPSFDGFGPPLVTAGMACIIVVTWSRQGGVPWTHLALLVLAAGWTLMAVRTVTLGALMLAPLLAAAIQTWLPAGESSAPRRGERTTLVGALGLCLVALAVMSPSAAASPAKVPTALADELDELPRGTTILNSYGIGGWLHWRHPALTPTADGLTEAYGPAYIERYFEATDAHAGWQWVVRTTGARIALLSEDEPLEPALRERLGWQVIGTDRGYVLLQAPGTRIRSDSVGVQSTVNSAEPAHPARAR